MNKNPNAKTILVVDDDPDYRELTRVRLETSGYQVSCLESGKQALALLKEGIWKPDLIIMDVDMPDKSGLSTLIDLNIHARIKEKTEQLIPIIVATGFQSEVVREMAMAQQVSDFLRKPYHSEELIEKVKRLIGS